MSICFWFNGSFLSSQKLFKTKHEFIRFGRSLILISISLFKRPKRAFNQTNAHSITIRVEDKRKAKNSWNSSFAPFGNPFIKQGNTGQAGSPSRQIGTAISPSTMTFSHLGMLPFRISLLKVEVENMWASCTLPGYLIMTSVKQYL